MTPAQAAYGVSCVLFAALALGVCTAWRRGLAGLWLTPALVVSAVWALMAAAGDLTITSSSSPAFAFSVLRSGFWLVVVARLLGSPGSAARRTLINAAVFAPIAVLVLGMAPAVVRGVAGLDIGSKWPVMAGELTLSLLALVLVEETYRRSAPADRWALKYVLLGVTALQLFDLLHSLSAYVPGPPAALAGNSRAAANVIGPVMLFIGLPRLSRHRPPTQIFQGVVIYSGVLIAVAAYLACVGLAIVGMATAGVAWGEALQALILTTALLGLVAMASSAQVRAWAKVLLAKTFAPYRYDYRAEWMRLTAALTGANDARPLAERALRAFMQIVHSPSGGVWTRDDDDSLVPVAGELSTLASNVAKLDEPWIRYMEEREWVVEFGVQPPASAMALHIPHWLAANPRAWLVVPLVQGSALEGFVVLARSLGPREALRWEDLDLLRITGRQVAAILAHDRVARRLVQSQQFEAYNRFAAFMMHDLKNIAAQLSLVVQNAELHYENPEFVADSMATVDNASRRLRRLLEQFRHGDESSGARTVNVVDACRQVVVRCGSSKPYPTLVTETQSAAVVLDPERLAHVIEHVVRNAQQATPADGTVTVTVLESTAGVVIEVADTGSGMSAEFIRDRLFRPFQSTKGSHGMGIGAYQTREFVRGAGGTLRVSSVVGQGTCVRIELPSVAQEPNRIVGVGRG